MGALSFDAQEYLLPSLLTMWLKHSTRGKMEIMMKKGVTPALMLLTELKKSPGIHGRVVTRRGERRKQFLFDG